MKTNIEIRTEKALRKILSKEYSKPITIEIKSHIEISAPIFIPKNITLREGYLKKETPNEETHIELYRGRR